MILADLCVRRPVFATMFVGVLVVLGWFSYMRLGVDLFPKVDVPMVMITTFLPGAAPEETEARVTKPLEEAINTVSGIDELRSNTLEGVSRIMLQFKLDRELDAGVQDVRDKISTVLDRLPDGTKPPLVQKFDVGATPVLTITVTGYQNLKELTELARRRLKEPLESTDGVGSIDIVGGREREIHIAVDADKLHATGVTIQQVGTALARQNVEFPGGRMKQGMSEEMLRTLGRITEVPDFAKVIVTAIEGKPVTVGDVAAVEDSVKEPRSLSRWDGKNAVSLIVRKQSGANSIEVVDRIKERFKDLKGTLPPGVDVIFTRDSSKFVREAVHTVQEHLVMGGICAAIVVFFFLGSIRSTIIAAVAIPVSIISTYSLILWMGFTLNRMTLLALTLSVGIVIDDAIVVLENIWRFIEEKHMDPMAAAKAATAEVGLAVSATTLSLAVIFVPVAFIHGVMGRFLNSFGLTMAFSIMVSLLVAFTLTPMLCSRYLKATGKGGAKHSTKDWKIFRLIEDNYDLALRWSLDHRWVLVVISIALMISIPFLGKMVGATFMPDDDSGEFAVNVRTPPGYSLAHTDGIVAQIEDRLRTIPEVRDLFTTVGATNGEDRVTVAQVVAKLFPLDQRKRSQEDIMASARKLLNDFPALRISVDPIKPWEQGGYREVAVEYDMRGPDLETLKTYASTLMARLRKIPGIVDLDSSYEGGLPELQVNIDRTKSADLGVSVDDIALTMRTMVQGDVITRFREGQDTYDVRLQLAEKDRNNPVVVAGLTIPSSKVGQVRLDNVATLTHGTGPVQIDRQDRQRNISIVFNLAPGFAMNKVMDTVTREVESMHLPAGYIAAFGGQSKIYGEMVTGFVVAFLLSIIFMYMVLAAQFESFVHPITIMLSLPLAVPFALISLLVFREHLMLFSTLGILLLFGIVKKNSILQLDQTLNLLRSGMPRRQAILTANRDRLRPILMTTAALVAGMIPVALGQGAGDSSIRAIALVVIGGQTLCLLITLLITPVAFSLFDDMEHWFRAWRKPAAARLKLVEPAYDLEPERSAID
ncbi:MAG: efflux RND transporter permease subunit [Candidatus Binatus sp.]|uniref:efflux RND transporter permease subunit n=1 Tax=Candidatus Binatus sp. TaxID=2811406 RepID=UPI00271ADD83|nr:efflux RND transporter permease subunit [Candidatus Binatus sp.]MDO8432663.1 efflux RND transporter permease subunit [Candidatus Binatus sp.]